MLKKISDQVSSEYLDAVVLKAIDSGLFYDVEFFLACSVAAQLCFGTVNMNDLENMFKMLDD